MGEKLTVLNLRKKIKKYIKKPILINWMNENLNLISKSRKVSVRKPVLNGINEIIQYIKYHNPINYSHIVDSKIWLPLKIDFNVNMHALGA